MEGIFYGRIREDNKYGFISPSGEKYACRWAQHMKLAEQLAGTPVNPDELLLASGWVKVYRDWNLMRTYYAKQKLTPEQVKKLEEWGLEVPEWDKA